MNTGQRIICQTGNVYVTCDKCGLRESGPVRAGWEAIHDEYLALHARVLEEGWRYFQGRSLRTYCADCAPPPGHMMEDVTAAWGERVAS